MLDVAAYKRDGYILQRGFFDPAEVRRIREDAKEIFISQMLRLGIVSSRTLTETEFERGLFRFFETDLPSFVFSGKQAQHLVSLHRLSLDERIIAGLKDLGLAVPAISTRPVLFFNSRHLAKKEVYWKLDLHQDWRSMQGSLDAVIVWVPLAVVDKSLGALQIIPGSHIGGLVRSDLIDGYGHLKEAVDVASLVSVEVQPGDALFFSSFLLHQSGTNATDSIRWSCHFRYNNLAEPTFVKRGFPHPYIYQPQPDLITPDFPTQAEVQAAFATDGKTSPA